MRETTAASAAVPAAVLRGAPASNTEPNAGRHRAPGWFAGFTRFPTYVARQRIVDRSGNLRAYEMLYRGDQPAFAQIDCETAATGHVLACCLEGLGLKTALEGKPGYLNVGRDLLFSDAILSVPSQYFVLEILENICLDAAVLRRLAALRDLGYRLALDDVTMWTDAIAAALPFVGSVKVDFLQADRAELPRLAAELGAAGKVLIAEKVETASDVALATRLGFSCFQGYYFARPELLMVPGPAWPAHC